MGYEQYWGKASGADFHPLAYHALDVAAVGAELLARDSMLVGRLVRASGVSADSLRRCLPFFLGLHDLGKFADGFQDLRADLREQLAGRRVAVGYVGHHGTLGYRLWLELAPLAVAGGMLRLDASGDVDASDALELALPWIAAVTGHHGEPPDGGPCFGFSRRAKEDAANFVRETHRLIAPGPMLFMEQGDYGKLSSRFRVSSWLVAGLAVLCDWIGSNREFFPFETWTTLGEHWPRARDRAARALASLGVLPPVAGRATGVGQLFPKISKPTPLQRLMEEVAVSAEAQLFVIEDVTGSGKTEAALVLAQRLIAADAADGIFFALPTMATANGMFGRVAGVQDRLFGAEGPRASVVLAHSARHLVDLPQLAGLGANSGDATATVDASGWLGDNRKKALLAALGVGTVDQALLGVIASRHNSLRVLGMHRHVLVVDEVHAYDAYMLGLLEALLALHAALGGTAILLSATLPATIRARLVEAFRGGIGLPGSPPASTRYPLVTSVDRAGLTEAPSQSPTKLHRKVGVEFLSSEAEAVGVLEQASRSGRCAVWIRNSVGDAMEGFALLQERLGPDRVSLFHARFLLGDRLAIESGVLSSFGADSAPSDRTGRVLVATQVVEQSLDLDFDVMVTDLAPIDLLIQRAGRLHRHPRDESGARVPGTDRRGSSVLRVLSPRFVEEPDERWLATTFRRTARVYPDHPALWRTVRELRDAGAIETPGRSRALVEAVYGPEAVLDVPAGLQRADIAARGAEAASGSLAAYGAVKWELGYERTGPWLSDSVAPTRLGDPSETVRLACWSGEDLVPLFESQGRSWDLSQVSVRTSLLAGAFEEDDSPAVAAARATMSDLGKHCRIIPVRRVVGGWEGRGRSGSGREVVVRYSKEIGLTVSRR